MLPLLIILVLTPARWEVEGRPALHEDVNVLVYGTLQLGQAVGDTYGSTNEKLQKIQVRQSLQEWKLERLRSEVAQARREERRLVAEVERLQRDEGEIWSFSSMVMGKLRDLQRGYQVLHRRVYNLENGLEISPALKAQVEQQQLMLQVVSEAVTKQQTQMENQGIQLKKIQRKMGLVL